MQYSIRFRGFHVQSKNVFSCLISKVLPIFATLHRFRASWTTYTLQIYRCDGEADEEKTDEQYESLHKWKFVVIMCLCLCLCHRLLLREQVLFETFAHFSHRFCFHVFVCVCFAMYVLYHFPHILYNAKQFCTVSTFIKLETRANSVAG